MTSVIGLVLLFNPYNLASARFAAVLSSQYIETQNDQSYSTREVADSVDSTDSNNDPLFIVVVTILGVAMCSLVLCTAYLKRCRC